MGQHNVTNTRTSEAVSIGHPDKIADQIADSILDLLRSFKHNAQSAVEVACSANNIFIFGEIDKDIIATELDNGLLSKITEEAIRKVRQIGYSEEQYNPKVVIDLNTQSVEINSAVEETETQEVAAGDQGIVSGYATNETTQKHELHYLLPHYLLTELTQFRKNNTYDFLNPDGKTQVTIEYKNNKPYAIKHILISQCHKESFSLEDLQKVLKNFVEITTYNAINDFVSDEESRDNLVNSLGDAEILINPAGQWNIGGPVSDSGLTGRKLVVDNYGSSAPIGGGSTAGKDLNKVDRSGAYYARNIAKSIVSSGLAERALVNLSFAIGVSKPTAITFDTFGTNTISENEILSKILDNYDFTVREIIELSESVDSFSKTSENSNYLDDSFPWEQPRSLV